MPAALYATATDLNHYAEHPDAAHELPRIIRRLIHASEPHLTKLHFPAGKGTSTGGWDGEVEGATGNDKVPAGRSVWELSTDKDPGDKAQRDYVKRSFEEDHPDRDHLTFVHVNLRSWNRRKTWVEKKKEEKNPDYPWKDLEAYDADDLQDWLERHPALHVWVSHLIGLRPPHVEDLEGLWNKWAKSTRPAFTPELLLAGREQQAQRVLQWLQGDAGVLAVKAETREEATMFLAAVLLREGDKADPDLARALQVSDTQVWNQVQRTPNSPMVLIPEFEDRRHVHQATENGHHVFLPLGRSGEATSDTVVLPVLNQQLAEKALEQLGIPGYEATHLLTHSRGRVPVLHRMLVTDRSSLARPVWSDAAAADLIPLMLVGSWDEDHEADTQVITKLARKDAESLQERLVHWLNVDDAPILKADSVWQLVSLEDAWALLCRHVTQSQLTTFHHALLDVLGEQDPKYDLTPDDRPLAAVLERQLTHSDRLRTGMAEALAVMGAWDWSGHSRKDGGDLVEQSVRTLLKDADWKRWASLSDVLSELAEAAPDAFLDAAQKHTSALLETFQPDAWGNSPHVAMMFTLEMLAWSPTHLAQVTRILSDLTVINPEATRSTGKSPRETLSVVFNPGCAQTTASAKERLKVMAGLHQQEKYRRTAQKLYLRQLPTLNGSLVFGTHKPTWRHWLHGFEHTEGPEEYMLLFNTSLDVLLKDANREPSAFLWKSLLQKVRALRGEPQSRVLQALQKLNPQQLSSQDLAVVWGEVRSLLHQAASFHDDPWLNTAEPQTILSERLHALVPPVLKDRHLWLFQKCPQIAGMPESPYRPYLEALHRLQIQAIEEIFTQDGLKGLLDFALHLEPYHANRLGIQAVHVPGVVTQEDVLLETTLGSDQQVWVEFAQGFITHRFAVQGWPWADPMLEGLIPVLPVEALLNFFLPLTRDASTWQRLQAIGPELEKRYWETLPDLLVNRVEDMEHAVKCLLEQNRPWFALDAIGHRLMHEELLPVRTALILEVMEQAIRKENLHERFSGEMLWHHLKVIFEHLQNDREITAFQLAEIEWKLMPFFTVPGQSPAHLHQWMVARPDFFAVVMQVYLTPVDANSPDVEAQRKRWWAAYNLVSSFQHGPDLGLSGKGLTLTLVQWAPRALAACAALGCDALEEVGWVVSHCDSEDIWPPEAVRHLIEELASEDFDKGVLVGRQDQRGLIKKAHREAGAQEHALKARHLRDADVLQGQFPRTSRMLRKLANSYRRLGDRDDRDDELEH
ncbi:hypothetical protein [Deinococcus roseus]|uniref:Uncharacterized protein n=1 Tax=Deinococcus roseus TaxID=392414 RepID=A0ABQ2D5F4_9DEIO|nr:hypothetical protein [Deinococcus roseus]GGJ44028.1 hypothetical protein GCM10008938_32880 [Deinococcus roseus]